MEETSKLRPKLPPALEEACRHLFARADANGDGELSRRELYDAVKNDAELRDLLNLPVMIASGDGRQLFMATFDRMDFDSNHKITFSEFCDAILDLASGDDVPPRSWCCPCLG